MKKVIDKKLYDTETAEVIYEWENAYFPNDFHFCAETLYRTKKGAWFIYGTGGALSSYRRQAGSNSWCGGEGITALSGDEAYELWVQQCRLCYELYGLGFVDRAKTVLKWIKEDAKASKQFAIQQYGILSDCDSAKGRWGV